MAKGNRGKPFEHKIIASLNKIPGVFGLRLAESIKGAMCFKCHSFINISNKSRKQPFDFLALCTKGWVALEAKTVQTPAFDFRNLKDHQEAFLTKAGEIGHAIVVIEYSAHDDVFCVPIKRYMEIKEEYSKMVKPRKSLPYARILHESETGLVYRLKKHVRGDKYPLDFEAMLSSLGVI